jgi:uncharacterized protein (TIGR03435 family)
MTFDVVAIHESREGNMSYIDNVPGNSYWQAGQINVFNLILAAYDLLHFQLLDNLPDWAKTTRYDVAAKSDTSTDEALAKLSDCDFQAEKRHMLQGLLAERFKLQIHPETRESTTYELVTTGRTAKLMTPVHGDVLKMMHTCLGTVSRKGEDIESKGCTISSLASRLQGALDTYVVDHTGLSGMYAYHLMMWSGSSRTLQDGEERYPDLVDALREQLGLELKKTKGPVTYWVVDHVERPTPN